MSLPPHVNKDVVLRRVGTKIMLAADRLGRCYAPGVWAVKTGGRIWPKDALAMRKKVYVN